MTAKLIYSQAYFWIDQRIVNGRVENNTRMTVPAVVFVRQSHLKSEDSVTIKSSP
jgi:hypothetical protein